MFDPQSGGMQLFELLGGIDDKWITEAQDLSDVKAPVQTDPDRATRPVRVTPSQPKPSAGTAVYIEPSAGTRIARSIRRVIVPIGAIAAAALLAFGISRLFTEDGRQYETTVAATSAAYAADTTTEYQSQENTTAYEETTAESAETIPESWEPIEYSPTGLPIGAIPALPSESSIAFFGETLTDEEANDYFTQNLDAICDSLRTDDQPLTSPRISEKGYCHVRYGSKDISSPVVDMNIRSYLLYDGDELAAVLVLYKTQDGILCGGPGIGKSWYPEFDAFLKAHKGNELVFVNANGYEIVLAPNGDCINPMGISDETTTSEDLLEMYLGNIRDPYQYFYAEPATYTP